MTPARTQGAVALGDWCRRHGKAGYDALWRRCGVGIITAQAMIAGRVLPDAGLAEPLAVVTAGAVTIEMFDVPAGQADG